MANLESYLEDDSPLISTDAFDCFSGYREHEELCFFDQDGSGIGSHAA